jgi:prepilin-type N-terminal cleavage/methylation domain-containing protein
VSALRQPGERGFTLLEVMAAVLVLGILYSVLANAAIRGLRSEGESKRRIEASLLADRALSDLEIQLSLGQIPEKGATEETFDPYVVSTTVVPFDPTPMLEVADDFVRKRGGSRPSSGTPPTRPGESSKQQQQLQLPGAEATAGAGAAAPNLAGIGESLLAPPSAGQDGRLRRIDVVVRWQEGVEEESVVRTTFAFDTTGLEGMFPEDGAAGGEAPTPEEEMQKILESLGPPGGGEESGGGGEPRMIQ